MSNIAAAQLQARSLIESGAVSYRRRHSSNVTALPANQDAPAMSARMAAFIAEELLPLMAGSWPASANQLDANARGVALAWGGVLRGFLQPRSGRWCRTWRPMWSASSLRARQKCGQRYCAGSQPRLRQPGSQGW